MREKKNAGTSRQMRDTWQVCRRHLRMRSSQAKNKETVATQITQTQKSTLPSPTGMQSRQTGANTEQGPLAEIRTGQVG